MMPLTTNKSYIALKHDSVPGKSDSPGLALLQVPTGIRKMNRLIDALRKQIALPGDDTRELTRKATFLIFGLLMSVGGVVWAAACFAFGLFWPAIIPLAYTLVVGLCIGVFVVTRRYVVVSRIQLLLSLILPFALQWSLGGFKKSGAMMYWAIIAPLAAQFFGGVRLSRLWFFGFLVLTIASGFLDQHLAHITGLPEYVHVPAFVINLGMVTLFIVFASQYFYAQMLSNQQKLADSLREVSELKTQQDGDYYLTSLLVSPLIINTINSENTTVEFFIRQKKQFHFNNTDGEIGGDFCAAEFITLQGRKYAALMNADAMGKSIQGAGGALVVGTILHLLFERTRIMENYRSMLPERWLKNAYTELKAAFETLDGRMQISFILALYDEHTATLYHINAEHPMAVAVHNGVPQFIHTPQVGAKLGSGREADYLNINVLGLKAGDFVFFGSDGKDDILFAQDGHEQTFNDDETFFLRKISESEGKLEEIFRRSCEAGTIIDDYSLLKLQVQAVPACTAEHQSLLRQELATLGAQPAANDIDAAFFRKILKRLVSAKDFAHAFALAETAVREYPLETQFILAAAYTAGKIGLHDRAVDYGESLVLRGSGDAQVSLILARSYLSLGQLQRSRHYYDLLPESLKWHASTHRLRRELYGN